MCEIIFAVKAEIGLRKQNDKTFLVHNSGGGTVGGCGCTAKKVSNHDMVDDRKLVEGTQKSEV